MQVYLAKPLGLRFARGNDGAAYIVRSDSKLGSTDPRIEVDVFSSPHALPNTPSLAIHPFT